MAGVWDLVPGRSATEALCLLAMVTVGVGALTAPVADAAAVPATSARVTAPSQAESRARVADPIADLALVALGTLDRYVETGSADQLASYEQQRAAIADAVAARLGIDAGRLRAAWAVADTDHQQALMGGLTQLGVPYRRNTSKPGVSFDCIGQVPLPFARISGDGRFRFVMQGDGNLVLYAPGNVPLWASNTSGHTNVWDAVMQSDGNLVVYDAHGHALWASNTHGHAGARLIAQSDGNVVIYDPVNHPLWATNTSGH